MAAHNDLGKWGEAKAAEYLESKGYRIVERNWRIGHRDLDIVAIGDGELAIVEVKTRSENFLVEPELAVDSNKIRSLTLAANAYVKTHNISIPVRFDIIAIVVSPDASCRINHIENAFLPFVFWHR